MRQNLSIVLGLCLLLSCVTVLADIHQYIQFRDKIAPNTVMKYKVLPWTKAKKADITKRFEQLYKMAPGLVQRASNGYPINLYYASSKTKLTRPDGGAVGYAPAGWANKGNHALTFSEKFFKKRKTQHYLIFLRWYFIHEVAHLADSGGKIARSKQWQALVGPRLKKLRALMKDENLSMLKAQGSNRKDLAKEAGLITVYSGQTADEALAEYTSAMLVHYNPFYRSGATIPETIKQFIRKNMLSKPEYLDRSINLAREAKYLKYKKQYKAALAKLNAAIKMDPKYGNAYYLRAQVYFKLKLYPEALENFNQAKQYIPKTDFIAPTLYVMAGRAAGLTKNFKAAEIDMKTAIQLKPKDPGAYYWLGQLSWVQKQYQQAAHYFKVVIRLAKPKSHYSDLAWLHQGQMSVQLKRYKQANYYFTALIKQNPKVAMAYAYRGISYLMMKDYQKSAADLETAIRLSPALKQRYGSWLRKAKYLAREKTAQ